MRPIFFYGTLRDPELLAVVIGRPLGEGEIEPARAPDVIARRIAGQAYPMLLPEPGAVAEGLVFRPAREEDVARICYYEEAEYDLVEIAVETPGGAVTAAYFRATGRLAPGEGAWDIEAWADGHRLVALEAARELMEHVGVTPVERMNTIWPGIMNRARQRARAMTAEPVLGGLRTPFSLDRDVRWESRRRVYSGYLSVEEHELHHRSFSGGWVGPVPRTTVAWGDAVTVLPYDPASDRLLLIEQFRVAAAARGDRNPWCIEVVAGRIDEDETAADCARREALEEAGLGLGRMVEVPAHYPTPGLASEHLSGFIAEADLSAVEARVHGNPAEWEDIRTIALSFDEAMRALEAGAVNTGPCQILLLWLARHRARLRAEWGGTGGERIAGT